MGLFGRKKRDEETDNLIASLQMNMANNYKDAAQQDYRKLVEVFEQKKASGAYSEKILPEYEKRMKGFSEKLEGYSHGDQKPYWTKE